MLTFEVHEQITPDPPKPQGYSLTGAQRERVKAMAKVHNVSASRLVAALIDAEWRDFLAHTKGDKK